MSIAENMVKALGIDPDQLKGWIASIVADARHVRDQVDAAKQGFVGAVGHFNRRLDAIEAQNADLIALNKILIDHIISIRRTPGAHEILPSSPALLETGRPAADEYLINGGDHAG